MLCQKHLLLEIWITAVFYNFIKRSTFSYLETGLFYHRLLKIIIYLLAFQNAFSSRPMWVGRQWAYEVAVAVLVVVEPQCLPLTHQPQEEVACLLVCSMKVY